MKHFKIIRLVGLCYQNCVEDLLAKNPNFAELSYDEQQKTLFKEFYGYGNSISWHLSQLGHQASELVYDFELMQKTWAKERGLKLKNSKWQVEIILAQIEYYKPEIVYLQDILCLPPDIINALKELFPFIKMVIVFRGFPKWHPTIGEILGKADLALVGSPHLVKHCAKVGVKAHLTYHFFDERILSAMGEVKQEIDFSFIGSSGYGYGADHAPRYWMLRELLEKTNLHLWIDEKQNAFDFKSNLKKALINSLSILPSSYLKKNAHLPNLAKRFFIEALENKKRASKSDEAPKVPLRKIFPERCQEGVFGLQMYRKLAQTKVSFNKHSGPAIGAVDNIRLFQATGMQSCLLTDSGENILDLFEPDKEILTYSSLQECLEKINFLSNNEKARAQMAQNGQKRVLKDHTALQRCKQIDELIQKNMK